MRLEIRAVAGTALSSISGAATTGSGATGSTVIDFSPAWLAPASRRPAVSRCRAVRVREPTGVSGRRSIGLAPGPRPEADQRPARARAAPATRSAARRPAGTGRWARAGGVGRRLRRRDRRRRVLALPRIRTQAPMHAGFRDPALVERTPPPARRRHPFPAAARPGSVMSFLQQRRHARRRRASRAPRRPSWSGGCSRAIRSCRSCAARACRGCRSAALTGRPRRRRPDCSGPAGIVVFSSLGSASQNSFGL